MSNIPAFPVTGGGFNSMGMTLRDYFAASVIGHLHVSPLRQEMTLESDAKYAYIVADAMLKARGK